MPELISSSTFVLISKIVRPLIRVLLKHQISYGEFSSIIRREYVEVAHSEFSVPNRRSTYSKVAVMTGIDRKLVKQILKNEKDNLLNLKVPTNKGLTVVKAWMTLTEYLDATNKPANLPLKGSLSFESLVKKSCPDLTPRSVIDELKRAGIVIVSDNNTVKLTSTMYDQLEDELILIGSLLNSAESNQILKQRGGRQY